MTFKRPSLTLLLGCLVALAFTGVARAQTAPGFYRSPTLAIAVEGVPVTFSAGVSGLDTTLTWQRAAVGTSTWIDLSDGADFSGVHTEVLTVAHPTLAMYGDRFRLVAVNAGGSAESAPGSLVVSPPVPPLITGIPAALSFGYSATFSLNAYTEGIGPRTYQWYFNDEPIPGATSYFYIRYNCTPADSGNYTIKVTNAGGTASATTNVTIGAQGAVTIIDHPDSRDCLVGDFVNLGVQVFGSDPVTYQWYRNGVPLPQATTSYIVIPNATSADTGDYTVKVTGSAGSATSLPATVTVLPLPLPRIVDVTIPPSMSSGTSFSSSVFAYGSGPATYQWYKDGVPIAGAVNSAYYLPGQPARANAGNYTVQVTSPDGMAMSADNWVSWSDPSTAPWRGVARQGDIVYILANLPGRILRYDLAQETWLPVVYLDETKVPTAFLPTAEGVFIAYAKELVRRDLDLTNETPVATSSISIQCLWPVGGSICFLGEDVFANSLRSYDRTTLVAGPSSNRGSSAFGQLTNTNQIVHLEGVQELWLAPGNQLESFAVTGGTVADERLASSLEAFSESPPLLPSPDHSLVATGSGVLVSTSSRAYAGSLGRPFDDAVFLADDRIVALRGRQLMEHAGAGWAPVGDYTLAADGLALFQRDGNFFVFGAPETGSTVPVVQKVATSALTAPPAPVAGSPVHRKLSLDDMFMAANGVLHIVSRSERGVVRWNPQTREFLPTLPLRGPPLRSSYAPAVDRLVLAYGDGALADIFPGSAPTEEVFGYTPSQNRNRGMVTMDELSALNLRSSRYGDDIRVVVDSQGKTVQVSERGSWGEMQSWQSATRRVYGGDRTYNPGEDLWYVDVPSTGELPATAVTRSSYGPSAVGPLRFDAEGARLLTPYAWILDAYLQPLAALPNLVADGVWQADSLFTIRVRPNGTQVQKWAGTTYTPEGQLTVPGLPQRIFRLDSSSLVVVTTIDGYLVFSIVGNGLETIATISNDPTYPPARPASFDAEAYLANNPDVGALIGNVPDRAWKAWEHYWKHGLAEGRTDGDFNVQAYLAQYPDLAAQFGSDLKAAALYWYTTGRKNGDRIPAGFSLAGYFLRNSDIAAIFANDKYGAWLHYYNYGVFEGRSFDANFIVDEYLELNPDLKGAFGNNKKEALMHWLTYGHPLEDRMGRVPIGFNVDSYLARYPDLAAVFGDITPKAVRNVTVWHHYVEYGTLEGRTDGDFEAYNYLATNPDLAAVFGSDIRAAALHWFFYGRREGRRIPGGFDVADYRVRYPDIVVGLGDDLYGAWLHYRDTGVYEGRVFGELFRPADYLALNPDVAAAIGNDYRDALLHWLYYGQFEGRPGRY